MHVKRRKLRWYGHVTLSSGLSLSYSEQCEKADEETDREKDGLALNGTSYGGKLRTARSGGS